MKVGIFSFEETLTSKTLRGISTTTRYLQQNLKNAGVEGVDLIVYGKNDLNYPKEFAISHHCRNLNDLSQLRDLYDFIIYFTPGHSWEKFDSSDPNRYIDVLEAVNLPFTFIYHSEEYATHQPYRMNFVSHRLCKFLVFITDGMQDIYTRDLEVNPHYVVVGMLPPLNAIEDIISKKKSNSVIITSAWTNFKRNLEYFALVDKFIEMGLTPYSAGSPSSSFYLAEIADTIISRIDLDYDDTRLPDERSLSRYIDYSMMMSRIGQNVPYKRKDLKKYVRGATIFTKSGINSWYDYGSYFPEQLPEILGDKKFHWNLSCYKINKAYVPRFEIVTLEAFNEGCLPVICRETTPDWVPDDSAIRLGKKDYTQYLHILTEMSEEERICRLTRFYRALQDRLYRNMFEGLKCTIEYSIE